MDRRLLPSLALLAALVAGGVALAALSAPAPAGPGEHALRVEGPDSVLFEGPVRAAEATALGALLAGAEAGGFDVELEAYPMGTYVRAIAGHRASGASGWLYEVEGADGWILGDRSAAAYPLLPQQAVRWRWTDDGL